MSALVTLLATLLIAHAVCDFPLQGDFMAKAKNPAAPIVGVPWSLVMVEHAAIHAGAVWFLTGIGWLAVCELVAHFIIDVAKCRNRISFAADQALHAVCKVAWVICVGVTTC